MGRYDGISIRIDKNKKRRYATIRYPIIDERTTDVTYTTSIGDTMDKLAYVYYNDVNLWWIIAQANGIRTCGTALEPGMDIRIPMHTREILKDFDNLNKG